MIKYVFIVLLVLSGQLFAEESSKIECVSTNRLSIETGTFTWLYLDKTAPDNGELLWKSDYNPRNVTGIFMGIMASARVLNRSLLIDKSLLKSISNKSIFISTDEHDKLANAIKIDVNGECEVAKWY